MEVASSDDVGLVFFVLDGVGRGLRLLLCIRVIRQVEVPPQPPSRQVRGDFTLKIEKWELGSSFSLRILHHSIPNVKDHEDASLMADLTDRTPVDTYSRLARCVIGGLTATSMARTYPALYIPVSLLDFEPTDTNRRRIINAGALY